MPRLQRLMILFAPNPRPLAQAVTFRAFGANYFNSHSPPLDRSMPTQFPASVPVPSLSAIDSETRRGRVSVPGAVATGSRGAYREKARYRVLSDSLRVLA